MDVYETGIEQLKKWENQVDFPCPNSTLKKLLQGNFQLDLIYLLLGDQKSIISLFFNTCLAYLKCNGFHGKIAYIDACNYFNPYDISKLAVRLNLSPINVLDSFLYCRAFTWDQLIEILSSKLSQLKNIKILIVAGLTVLWPNYEQKTFNQLKQAIHGIKIFMKNHKSLILLSTPLHDYSFFKPKGGGNNLAHFSHVIVKIEEKERFREYHLIKHPGLPEKKIREYLPKEAKLLKKINTMMRFKTLDEFFKK